MRWSSSPIKEAVPTATDSCPIYRWRKPPILLFWYWLSASNSKLRMRIISRNKRTFSSAVSLRLIAALAKSSGEVVALTAVSIRVGEIQRKVVDGGGAVCNRQDALGANSAGFFPVRAVHSF